MSSTIRKVSWFFLVSFLTVHSTHGLRILGVFPLHGKSHFIMCERLMRGLAERGHQVDIYSHFPLKKSVPNYTDFSLAGTMPALANNLTYEFFATLTDSFSVHNMLQIVQPLCDLIDLPIFQKLIYNPPKDPPYDVVITELCLTHCHLVWGRHLNIPMVAVATTTFYDWMNAPLGNPINLAVDPSVLSNSAAPMSFFERVNNVLISTRAHWEFNYYVQKQNAVVRKYFGSDFPNVVELQKDVSLVLVNYHQALNGIRPYTPAVVPVGGLHIVDNSDNLPSDVQKFLDESKEGFIYFSFGSMIQFETFPKHTQEAFYNTFKKIAPVRVLMKIAKPEILPVKLPSNVISHTWLPQIKVLKHKNIKAFITHGGLMGTQEAVYYGVPMVGISFIADQHFNLQSYAKKNMAVILDRHSLTEKAVTEAITQILKNPIYKKSIEKISKAFRDNPMDPMETSVFWIEYVVRHGKDALQSPLIDMPWWQANLLDVYGFIISLLLVVLCILKFMTKLLIQIFCKKNQYSKFKEN